MLDGVSIEQQMQQIQGFVQNHQSVTILLFFPIPLRCLNAKAGFGYQTGILFFQNLEKKLMFLAFYKSYNAKSA